MQGDDQPLDKLQEQVSELRRDFQEMKSKQLEFSSQQSRLEARLMALNVMLEERDQH